MDYSTWSAKVKALKLLSVKHQGICTQHVWHVCHLPDSFNSTSYEMENSFWYQSAISTWVTQRNEERL
jgi:hypothetical protein